MRREYEGQGKPDTKLGRALEMRKKSSIKYVKEVEGKLGMFESKGLCGGFCQGWRYLWGWREQDGPWVGAVGTGLCPSWCRRLAPWLLLRFVPFLSPARLVVTGKSSQEGPLAQGMALSTGKGSWVVTPSSNSLTRPGLRVAPPLESSKLADQGNCLHHAGFENKIPFQPLPFSTAGNQKLLIAEMRYGFSGAELGTGTCSYALVPTMKLVLRSCGHGARSAWLTLNTLGSFLCPRLGIIFVCAGTGWSGFGSAQAGKLR